MKRLLIGLSACLWTLAVHADTVSVAVAAKFTTAQEKDCPRI